MPMAGKNFDVNSSGFGDTRLSFLSKFKIQNGKTILACGSSTGSINERDVTPMSSDVNLVQCKMGQ